MDSSAPFGIWRENEQTVCAFMQMEAHWYIGRAVDGSARMAMDNSMLKSTLEMMGIKRRDWPKVFHGLKVMEAEALIELQGD